MGRKTHSTKSGGYMNPADQERKLARKRELKKNKKQRCLVRQAVLKSKDPEDLIRNIAVLDEMEFSYDKTPTLSKKVINEKRIKMRETFFKIMSMYKRENDNENVHKMRRMLEQYELKRIAMEDSYAAAKFSAETDPSEIPLPNSTSRFEGPPMIAPVEAVPLQFAYSASAVLNVNRMGSGILKKTRAFDGPGVPVGLPPPIDDIVDAESIDELSLHNSAKEKKVSFSVDNASDKCKTVPEFRIDATPWPVHMSGLPPNLAPTFPGRPIGLQAPPLVNPTAVHGIPREMFIGPSLPGRTATNESEQTTESKGPVIEAQPKLRNIREEVTRFVPTIVRVNRTMKYQSSWAGSSGLVPSEPHRRDLQYAHIQQQFSTDRQQTAPLSKDEIYEQFMSEVNKLL